MANDLAKKYKKHDLRTHIYELPDTYIGSIEPNIVKTFVIEDNKMVEKDITYIPGLYKIYDEIIVNATDHVSRLNQDIKNGKENIKPVKDIRVTINKETGYISVYNSGSGIEIEKHPENDLWIPEMIFGVLLTSSNYNKDDKIGIGGKNGIGSKATSIFSKIFEIETVDFVRKKIYKQTFKNNMLEKTVPEIKSYTKVPYTKITFLPDYERFALKGLTDDIFQLFERRVYDCSAVTPKEVSVYFNENKIAIKEFEDYANLFLEDKKIQPRIYESPNERWEVVASISKSGIFEQISFCNGINNLKGGTHTTYILNQITKGLVEMASKKKKTIKPQYIKDNLFLFIKSTIVNPSFDSQSKETLSTPVSKYGSKCELSEKFFDKLYKSGIIEKALSLTEITDEKKVVKTDGKKVNRIIVPKLDDANLAGTKDSAGCTLILTEGDSAKTMAISGLSVIGRSNYGVFPLRGKIMNVKDVSNQKIADNAEITALKKILGLEQNKKYTDLSSLRYGSIMIMTDQDHDGSHIKGLLFNVFQTLWPSLYKIEGFLTSMLTPIIKVTNTKTHDVTSFYNMTDYNKWKETEGKKGSYKIKYYKGLGTSKEEEAKEYFRHMKKVTYKYTDQSDESIDLAFNKKRADNRKEWLIKYDKDNVLDYTKPIVEYETFINKDLIHFSNRDLERSINHICDGLKESTRKILYACFKRKLYTNEIKVAQLAGNVSEVTAYHHGETSLQQAIIGMAQIFVGTNNINLLVPNGQFGTRILSGNDASSARYIYTLLSKLARLIFKEEDNSILNSQFEDGDQIEPEYYIPIIPMILVNGGIGIGTGFSTNIPQHNPEEIINICKKICDIINNEEDITKIEEIIKDVELETLKPYYLGFKGVIEHKEKNTYQSKGIYNWVDDSTVEITELPIGTWTEDYKNFLEEMLVNNSYPSFKNFESHYTAKNVKFILNMSVGARGGIGSKFENDFKLISTKNLSLNNLHLYSEEGHIKKYENTNEIVKEWAIVRFKKYQERKNNQIKIMEREYLVLSSKIRFILDVISNTIHIMNKKYTEIADQLTVLKYPKISNDEEDKEDDITEDNKAYSYLLKMPISQLTYERKIILEKQVENLRNEIEKLRGTSLSKIWKGELEELLKEWINHKTTIELEYENDSKTTDKTQKKVVKKAKK